MKNKFFSAWCERLGISEADGGYLIRLADKAADFQVRCHNDPHFPELSAEAAIQTFEDTAERLRFKTRWDGLYPTLVKDGRDFHLPD